MKITQQLVSDLAVVVGFTAKQGQGLGLCSDSYMCMCMYVRSHVNLVQQYVYLG